MLSQPSWGLGFGWAWQLRQYRIPLFQTIKIWYPILFCLLTGSLMSYKTVFVLQIELQIPPFTYLYLEKLSKIGGPVFFLIFMSTKNYTIFKIRSCMECVWNVFVHVWRLSRGCLGVHKFLEQEMFWTQNILSDQNYVGRKIIWDKKIFVSFIG